MREERNIFFILLGRLLRYSVVVDRGLCWQVLVFCWVYGDGSWYFNGFVVVIQLFFYGLCVMLVGSGEVLLGRIER